MAAFKWVPGKEGFVSPKAMRMAVVLAGVGTREDARVLNLRELRAAWNDLSERERVAGIAADERDNAERLSRMMVAA